MRARGLRKPLGGVFLHSRVLGDPAELEEERRLCDVGVTRVRQRSYMTGASSRNMFGGRNYVACFPTPVRSLRTRLRSDAKAEKGRFVFDSFSPKYFLAQILKRVILNTADTCSVVTSKGGHRNVWAGSGCT